MKAFFCCMRSCGWGTKEGEKKRRDYIRWILKVFDSGSLGFNWFVSKLKQNKLWTLLGLHLLTLRSELLILLSLLHWFHKGDKSKFLILFSQNPGTKLNAALTWRGRIKELYFHNIWSRFMLCPSFWGTSSVKWQPGSCWTFLTWPGAAGNETFYTENLTLYLIPNLSSFSHTWTLLT